jgi:hypothetical protein
VSIYAFKRSARSPRAVGFVALWWIVLFALYLFFNAVPVIILGLAIVSLPALIDIGKGATSELQITQSDISWRSGRRAAQLPRGQLKSVRLDTRLDLTLRMTLITYQGSKVRLPYECMPPAQQIEAALKDQDILYERHHFTLLS